MNLHVEFRTEPSAAAFMLRAFLPSPGLSPDGLPPLRVTWRGHRVRPETFARFLAQTGLRAGAGAALLYPQVLGFRMQMVAVTHPAYPLPIWKALQIRNHLLLHRPIAPGDVLDLETRLAGYRVLDKGVEIDVITEVHAGSAAPHRGRVWDGLTTYYYRGAFGAAQVPSPLAQQPEVPEARLAGWTTPAGGGLRFGRLTGDYNGIHWRGAYARLFGFRGAFHHPQAVLGQCLARLAPPAAPVPHRLDAWLKGPVYYGSDVELRAAEEADDSAFALIPLSDGRPAIVGRWRACAEGSRLLDASAGA